MNRSLLSIVSVALASALHLVSAEDVDMPGDKPQVASASLPEGKLSRAERAAVQKDSPRERAKRRRLAGRPFLGIDIRRPHAEVLEHLQLPEKVGFLVTEVKPGGPAEQAGLLPGDLAIKLDGQWLITGYQFAVLLEMREAGDVVELEVRRQGEQMVVPVTVGVAVEKETSGDPLQVSEPKGLPTPLTIENQSMRVARVADRHGKAWLRKENGRFFLRIVDATGEQIFDGAVQTDEERAALPKIWAERIPLMKDALAKYKPQTRPRIVLPSGQ